jgi:hypothetical protein
MSKPIVENLSVCSYFKNDILLKYKWCTLKNDNIKLLDELFPSTSLNKYDGKLYKGYNIVIIKKKTTIHISINKKSYSNNSSKYNWVWKYSYIFYRWSNTDKKEGQYYIDLKENLNIMMEMII